MAFLDLVFGGYSNNASHLGGGGRATVSPNDTRGRRAFKKMTFSQILKTF